MREMYYFDKSVDELVRRKSMEKSLEFELRSGRFWPAKDTKKAFLRSLCVLRELRV